MPHHHTRLIVLRRRRATGLAALAAAAVLALPAGAAPPSNRRPASPPPSSPVQKAPPLPIGTAPRLTGLDERPLAVESLGLEFNPPFGATFHVQRQEGRVAVSLVDGAEIPAWSMRIQPDETAGPSATPALRMKQMLARWSDGGRQYTVVSNDPFPVAGRHGQLCFVEQEMAGGEPIVSGWLLVPRDNGELLSFAVQTLPSELHRVRPLLETCFATIRLTALSDIAQDRKEGLEAGATFLASLNPDRLRRLLDTRRWYRYSLPAAVTGSKDDTELGYYLVEHREGRLGEIDPTKAVTSFDPSEQTYGLLVHVHGHYIEAATQTTYDSQAYYWLAWDGAEEAWSIRGTRRYQGKELSEAMTGIRTRARTGNPAGTLTVINSGTAAASRDQRSWHVPDTYLSQALRWSLGRLMPDEPTSMHTYCFDNTGGRLSLSLRSDEWSRNATGRWQLKTLSHSDAPEVTSIYDDQRELIRRSWPEGPVTERITLEELHRLWRSKGLPTGGMQ